MKKVCVTMLALLVLFAFVGCATKSNDAPAADDWWNNPPADTADYHFEVGFAQGSNLQTSRDWAKANANQNLAQYINNSVQSIVTTYVNDAGELASNNMQSLQAFESVSKQTATAVLSGVTYKYAQADGGVYALAQLPIGELAEKLKEQAKESFQKNAAATAALDAMDKAIDKYFTK